MIRQLLAIAGCSLLYILFFVFVRGNFVHFLTKDITGEDFFIVVLSLAILNAVSAGYLLGKAVDKYAWAAGVVVVLIGNFINFFLGNIVVMLLLIELVFCSVVAQYVSSKAGNRKQSGTDRE